MAMTYEDQVGIGANVNSALSRVCREFGLTESSKQFDVPGFIGEAGQALLVQLDQAGYQIVPKRMGENKDAFDSGSDNVSI
jgi:hypothetical protein